MPDDVKWTEGQLERRIAVLEDAFDRLERATCGVATIADLREHFGMNAADQIQIARNDRARGAQ